jgi:hypothetical protein
MKELWPLETTLDDPHSDIHWELVGYGYEDYRANGGRLPQAEYEVLGRQFDKQIRAGTIEFDKQTVEALCLTPPFLLPAVPPQEPFTPMDSADIVRITTDFLPSLSQDAPDLVLGPWRDELNPAIPHDRRLLLRALTIAGVETIQGSRFSGAEMWARSNITPSAEARAQLRMVSDAPHSLWHIKRVEDGQATLEDLIGLDPSYLPPGPVRIRDTLSVSDCDGPYLLARVAYTPTGWEAHLPLALPAVPAEEQIHKWLQQEMWHARLRTRKLTLERLLRRRGHVLIRRLHEWLWLRQDDSTAV